MTDTEILDYLQREIEKRDVAHRRNGVRRVDYLFGETLITRNVGEPQHIRERLAEVIEARVAAQVTKKLTGEGPRSSDWPSRSS